jgi:methylated-DNA-[protein]-cysteine S-methyltransferase
MNAVDRSVMRMQPEEVSVLTVDAPMGRLHVLASERGVMYAGWGISEALLEWALGCPSGVRSQTLIEKAQQELGSYFRGESRTFTIPVVFEGTPFQQAVWQGLTDIPYGVTWSYKELAAYVGSPLAVRAVGQANRANRLAVIIPCHRVIGAKGQLVGYAGSSVDLKASLLDLEQRSGRIDLETANLV